MCLLPRNRTYGVKETSLYLCRSFRCRFCPQSQREAQSAEPFLPARYSMLWPTVPLEPVLQGDPCHACYAAYPAAPSARLTTKCVLAIEAIGGLPLSQTPYRGWRTRPAQRGLPRASCLQCPVAARCQALDAGYCPDLTGPLDRSLCDGVAERFGDPLRRRPGKTAQQTQPCPRRAVCCSWPLFFLGRHGLPLARPHLGFCEAGESLMCSAKAPGIVPLKMCRPPPAGREATLPRKTNRHVSFRDFTHNFHVPPVVRDSFVFRSRGS